MCLAIDVGLAVAAHLNYNSGSFGKGYFRCTVENLHMALAVGEPGYVRKNLLYCLGWSSPKVLNLCHLPSGQGSKSLVA